MFKQFGAVGCMFSCRLVLRLLVPSLPLVSAEESVILTSKRITTFSKAASDQEERSVTAATLGDVLLLMESH